MLSAIVGNVDWNAAAVLCIFFITLCVVTTALIAKRRSKTDVSNEFELAKIKLHNEDADAKRNNDRQREYELGKLAMEKEVQFKRIDGNMITSHARTSEG
jgi:hypothetical protein